MSGIAQGLVTHRMACSEQPQPVVLLGRPSSSGRWKPDRVAVWPVAGGAASHQLASTDLLPLSLRPARLLQLQHHTTAPASCQPAPLVLAPCDGALHMSGLQKDLGLGPSPLLPPHLLQAGVSPVASAAQLLDAHLRISGSTAPSPAAAAPQPRFAMLPVSLEPTGLPHGDCEMEDLTSGPLGTFVLVQ